MRAFTWVVLAAILAASSSLPVAPAQGQAPIPVIVAVVGPVDGATRARYAEALQAIIRYYQQEFGQVPVPSVQLYLYGSTEAFEKGLVELGGVAPDLVGVIGRANSAVAIARVWAILVNASLRRRLESQMAHEFMHLMQSAWSERRSDRRGPHWVREGMAVYYEGKTEEILKIRAFSAFERSSIDAMRERIDTLISLPLTMDFDLYVRLNGTLGRASNGWSILYAWSFIAYSRLTAKASQADVVRFFTIPNIGPSLEGAFQQAFQVNLSEFDADLKTYLQSLRQ